LVQPNRRPDHAAPSADLQRHFCCTPVDSWTIVHFSS
jgi:hypothetical protein